MATAAAAAAATVTTAPTVGASTQPNPVRIAPTDHQTKILAVLTTVGTTVAATASAASPAPLMLPVHFPMILEFCGSRTPEEDVQQLYHTGFIEDIGLERLARLRVVTGQTLDVDENLPWFIDCDFPPVDVAKMSDIAVRGESSRKETVFGTRKTFFIAIRYASTKSPIDKKVEFIFQDTNGVGWGQTLFGWGTRITDNDYARLRALLDGKQIEGAPECGRTHVCPDERFFMC